MKAGRSVPISLIFSIAAVLALAAGWWVWSDATSLDSFYQQQAEQHAQTDREAAHIHAEAACSRLPAPEIRACVHNEYHAANERERQDYDLEAQLISSTWARAMGLTAIIGMIVGILGVGLVYITFREARIGNLVNMRQNVRGTLRAIHGAEETAKALAAANETNRIASETATRQLRPYVSFTEVDDKTPRPFTRQSELKIFVKNFGRTPANEVQVTYDWEVRQLPIGSNYVILREPPESFGKLSPGDRRTVTVWLKQLTEDQVRQVKTGKAAILMRLKLTYEVAPGETDGEDITVWTDKLGWKLGTTRLLTKQDRERS